MAKQLNLAAVMRSEGNTERSACRKIRLIASQTPAGQAVVELGAYKGRTTGWIALGLAEGGRDVAQYAIDPWDLRPAEDWPADYADHLAFDTYGLSETFEHFTGHIATLGAPVNVIRGFAHVAAETYDGPPVGFLYHDADHSEGAVQRDLEAWLPHLAAKAVVALHDAGNPKFGVIEAAGEVFANREWGWATREFVPWQKHPHRRGLLVVRRR